MRKPLGDILLDIAKFAEDRDLRTLDYLLKMAADEAYDTLEEPFHLEPRLIGLWDWDVPNDKNFLDASAAVLFGVEPSKAIKGLANSEYIKGIHPDDVRSVNAALGKAISAGAIFEATYRVIANDRLRWIYARGTVFTGSGKTPVRFPGAMFDITDSVAKGLSKRH